MCGTMVCMKWAKKQTGFTIVELLIVVVVIAILAAITVVSYTNIQTQARDSQRKSDLVALAKAYSMYRSETSEFITSGGGTGNGDGWLNSTLQTTLRSGGHLGTNTVLQDPKCGSINSVSCPGYLLGFCGTGPTQRVILYAKMEATPSIPVPSELADCASNTRSWWTTYGSNYYATVN